MKRLTLNQDGEIKVKDIYGKMHDCKDVPNEFYGCIRKLYDFENTGYNPDFIDTIPHILMDMAELLENPTAESIKACKSKINYILSAKKKTAEALAQLQRFKGYKQYNHLDYILSYSKIKI